MAHYLKVRCSKCNTPYNVAYRDYGEIKPTTLEVNGHRELWGTSHCSNKQKCGFDTLVFQANESHPINKKPSENYGKTLETTYNTRSDAKRKASDDDDTDQGPSQFTKRTELDEYLAEQGVDEEDDDSEDDEDRTYIDEHKKYRGTKGRCNTANYSGNYLQRPAELGALRRYDMPDSGVIGAKVPREDASTAMGKHYAPGPCPNKTYIATLREKTDKGKAKSYLNSTKFANAFLVNDPALAGVFKRGNKGHQSMEWCHGLACSLGGSSSYQNLYAASYDANTFAATIEDWLRDRRTLMQKKFRYKYQDFYAHIKLYYEAKPTGAATRSSCRRAPKFIEYRVSASTATKTTTISFYINARCIGFSEQDYTAVRRHLDSTFD